MKIIIAQVLAILLLGCSSTPPAVFEVDSKDLKPTGAVLELYDVESSMQIKGTKLVGHRAIEADGSGKIIVNFPNGQPIICHIGYVTNGLEYHFQFEVKDGKCDLVQSLAK